MHAGSSQHTCGCGRYPISSVLVLNVDDTMLPLTLGFHCPTAPWTRRQSNDRFGGESSSHSRGRYHGCGCPKSQILGTGDVIRQSSRIPAYRVPNGTFIRQDSKSDMKQYGEMLGLLELNGIQRMTAINLIEGVEVDVNEAQKRVLVKYLTVVPFYQVVETYSLDGGRKTRNARRDLRGGDMVCSASLKNDAPPESGEMNMVLRLESYWKDPNAGGLLEEMHVAQGGEQLIVQSTVSVRRGTATCRIVYDKVDVYEPKFSWNPATAARVMMGGRTEDFLFFSSRNEY